MNYNTMGKKLHKEYIIKRTQHEEVGLAGEIHIILVQIIQGRVKKVVTEVTRMEEDQFLVKSVSQSQQGQ